MHWYRIYIIKHEVQCDTIIFRHKDIMNENVIDSISV